MTDTNIAWRVKDCLALNGDLIFVLDNAIDELPKGLPLSLGDQRSRFKIWSANIGAHKIGNSSLEYRLRDASHIKERVLDLLDELRQRLKDAMAITSGKLIPWDKLPEDVPLNDAFEADGMPATELEQIAMDVKEIVDGLLSLSILIRNPAPHDRFMASKDTDTSYYEYYDIEHVKAKFCGMEPWLAKRLGKAISQRRQYFKYRQSHHAKLALGIDQDSNKVTQSTLASSIPEKVQQDLGFTATDNDSESGWLSQTSFATSVQHSQKLRVPPLPIEARQGPFECPFCFMIIKVESRKSWKKHVYGDLRPYVCLELDCITPEQEFTRRHDWIEHLSQNHWTIYHCPVTGCSETFKSTSSCKLHVNKLHLGQIPEHQLSALVTLHSVKETHENGFICSLCGESQPSLAWYRRHVGRHEEQLSLFALRGLGSGQDQGSDEYSESGALDSSGDDLFGNQRLLEEQRTGSGSIAKPLSSVEDEHDIEVQNEGHSQNEPVEHASHEQQQTLPQSDSSAMSNAHAEVKATNLLVAEKGSMLTADNTFADHGITFEDVMGESLKSGRNDENYLTREQIDESQAGHIARAASIRNTSNSGWGSFTSGKHKIIIRDTASQNSSTAGRAARFDLGDNLFG